MSANMNKEPLIRVQDLGKSFGSIHVLKGINVKMCIRDRCLPVHEDCFGGRGMCIHRAGEFRI